MTGSSRSRRDLVRGLIYPVPDPRYPFLGVHFTRRVTARSRSGRTPSSPSPARATAARDVSPRDLRGIAGWPGFVADGAAALAHRAPRAARLAVEARLHAGRAALRAGARRRRRGPRPAGVRAQALDRDGTLVDDFRIHRLGRVTAVRNAPSPAATSSLAIAEYVADVIEGKRRN